MSQRRRTRPKPISYVLLDIARTADGNQFVAVVLDTSNPEMLRHTLYVIPSFEKKRVSSSYYLDDETVRRHDIPHFFYRTESEYCAWFNDLSPFLSYETNGVFCELHRSLHNFDGVGSDKLIRLSVEDFRLEIKCGQLVLVVEDVAVGIGTLNGLSIDHPRSTPDFSDPDNLAALERVRNYVDFLQKPRGIMMSVPRHHVTRLFRIMAAYDDARKQQQVDSDLVLRLARLVHDAVEATLKASGHIKYASSNS